MALTHPLPIDIPRQPPRLPRMQHSTPPSRREFLKQSALAGSAVAVGGLALPALAPSSLHAADVPDPTLPQPLMVPGVHGYTMEKSVQAGREIQFCLSGSVPHRLTICRLGARMDDPSGDIVLHEFPESPARVQPIHPGSYVHVRKGLPDPLDAFSLECWVRPWFVNRWAGLLTQHDYPNHCGWGLFIKPDGAVVFYLGDGGPNRPEFSHETKPDQLKARTWHHLVATWSGERAEIWVDGQRADGWNWAGTGRREVRSGPAPLQLGAYAEKGRTTRTLDGDLAMAVIHRRALDETAIRERFEQKGLLPVKGRRAWACWTFHEESGDRVEDVSPSNRHGQIINHGTWMIGGPSYHPNVPRFDTYDPSGDPERGHALRLASDDLYDCRWQVTHSYAVPPDARPGLHVGRVYYELDGTPRRYHITFIVRRGRPRKRAPILVLCASNTWLAYNGTPFGVTSDKLMETFGTGGTTNSPGDPPAYNFYRAHAAGQGTYQVGLRMPWPAAGPYILYGGPTGYSHLMRAERFTHAWLEQAGYEFDVITDLDLHRDPDQLRRYQVVLVNGHSEYWSAEMYYGLKEYLERGGNVVCLSGNSLFWRVSFNRDGTILECRKVDAPGNQVPTQFRGESWHSQDGRRGGLMRECGYPGWALVGLETLGWNNQGDAEQFGPYHVTDPGHFLFQKPEPVGVRKGDAFGQAPDGGLPRANGHEIDVRLSTLAALQEQPSPSGASVPPDPAGMVQLANGVIPWKRGGAAFDYFFRGIKPAQDQGGEVIYWERPEGGRVFNAGSIGSGWALHSDPKFQRLFKNVLHHFGVDHE